MEIVLANDRYRATLRSTWIASPADTTMAVTSLPLNVPTIVVCGWNTENEKKFYVAGKSGSTPEDYQLTGVVKLSGTNENLSINETVNCLNNEEFINQFGPFTPAVLPTGGTTGQILQKKTNTAYDAEWQDYTPPEDTGVPTPVGSIMPWAGADPPAGYLICNGAAVSRTTYVDLFTTIGTTYGVGNGTTTFNVPDLRGRVAVGKSTDTEFDSLGETGGEKTHVLTGAESGLRAHTHALPMALTGAPSGMGDVPLRASGGGDPNFRTSGIMSNSSAYGSAGITEDGSAHNNLQPYQVINYIIKALYISTFDWSSSASSFLTGSDSGWTAVTLLNGWVDYDANYSPSSGLYIRKIGNIVHMRGLIKNGTISAPAFVLPAGWIPSINLIFSTASYSAFGELRVYSNSNVVPNAGNNGWFSLSCTFFAG
jgi:microcystin-dependent protein